MSTETAELLIKINANTKKLDDINSKIDKVKTNTKSASPGFMAIAKSIGAANVAMIIFNKSVESVKQSIDTFKEFEKMGAIMENVYGSSADASAAIKMITKFAATTNFSLKESMGAFLKLKNRGIEPTAKSLKNMADIANSQGKSLDQLTEAVLDAMTGENERLKEFGIKAKDAGDKVKFTFKGVTKEVEKSEDAIRDAILSFGELNGVKDVTLKISSTLEGQMSNFGDRMDEVFKLFGSELASPLKTIMGLVSNIAEYLISDLREKENRKIYLKNLKELEDLTKAAKTDEASFEKLKKMYSEFADLTFAEKDFAEKLDIVKGDIQQRSADVVGVAVKKNQFEDDYIDIATKNANAAIDLDDKFAELSTFMGTDNPLVERANTMYATDREGAIRLLAEALESKDVFRSSGLLKDLRALNESQQKEAELKKKYDEEEKKRINKMQKGGESAQKLTGYSGTISTETTTSKSSTSTEKVSDKVKSASVTSQQNTYTYNIDKLIEIDEFNTDDDKNKSILYLENLVTQVVRRLITDTKQS